MISFILGDRGLAPESYLSINLEISVVSFITNIFPLFPANVNCIQDYNSSKVSFKVVVILMDFC